MTNQNSHPRLVELREHISMAENGTVDPAMAPHFLLTDVLGIEHPDVAGIAQSDPDHRVLKELLGTRVANWAAQEQEAVWQYNANQVMEQNRKKLRDEGAA